MSILDDYVDDGSIEEEKPLADKKDESLQAMVDSIKEEYGVFKEWSWDERGLLYPEKFQKAVKKESIIVSPLAIESYLNERPIPESVDKKGRLVMFSSMLVQNSYNHGHNYFNLPEK